MEHSFIRRFSAVSLFILALSLFASSASFGALNAYIIFKSSDGKIYKATPDANGKFTFTNVQPGTYSLILAGSDEYFAAKKKADKDKHKDEIELMSFSWGASSSTISSGSSSSSSSSASSILSKSSDKSTLGVAITDMNNDGRNDFAVQKIREPKLVSLDNPVKDGSAYYVVIMKDVIITSACPVSGTVNGIAINQPGVK